MDDTKQFAKACADFFATNLFTANVKPEYLALRIDAVVYLIAQKLLGDGPRLPTIEDMVMGTHGPTGGPHFGLLLDFLRGAHMPEGFGKGISNP